MPSAVGPRRPAPDSPRGAGSATSPSWWRAKPIDASAGPVSSQRPHVDSSQHPFELDDPPGATGAITVNVQRVVESDEPSPDAALRHPQKLRSRGRTT